MDIKAFPLIPGYRLPSWKVLCKVMAFSLTQLPLHHSMKVVQISQEKSVFLSDRYKNFNLKSRCETPNRYFMSNWMSSTILV